MEEAGGRCDEENAHGSRLAQCGSTRQHMDRRKEPGPMDVPDFPVRSDDPPMIPGYMTIRQIAEAYGLENIARGSRWSIRAALLTLRPRARRFEEAPRYKFYDETTARLLGEWMVAAEQLQIGDATAPGVGMEGEGRMRMAGLDNVVAWYVPQRRIEEFTTIGRESTFLNAGRMWWARIHIARASGSHKAIDYSRRDHEIRCVRFNTRVHRSVWLRQDDLTPYQ